MASFTQLVSIWQGDNGGHGRMEHAPQASQKAMPRLWQFAILRRAKTSLRDSNGVTAMPTKPRQTRISAPPTHASNSSIDALQS